MSEDVKIEMLKHTIDRYDHYYDSINNKGNLFLTLNTFLVGGIITGYYNIKDLFKNDCMMLFLVIVSLIFCLSSIIYTIYAILPYLNNKAGNINGSLLFFGNVSNLSLANFKKMYDNLDERKAYDDFVEQAHLLSIGLEKKFQKLKTATYLLMYCLVCVIIIGFKIFLQR